MKLIEVIPLVRLPRGAPDVLSYYTSRDIPAGSLVKITVNKRPATGVVRASIPLSDVKALVRKQDFSLKKIDAVLGTSCVPEYSRKLFEWTARYFCVPQPSVWKSALPNYFARPSSALQKFLSGCEAPPQILHASAPVSQKPIFVEGSFYERMERYLRELQELWRRNPRAQALILFPTVLDAAACKKILENIAPDAVVYTSALSQKTSAEYWRKSLLGETRLILGTRNAVFVPIPFLGCIIVDAENSMYHKSWEQHPKYDARDIAEKIAETRFLPLILGGNFPREETWHRIQSGEITKELCGTEKAGIITVIDTAKEAREAGVFRVISASLERKIREALERREHIFCFSGRRGYASSILCRDCGHLISCPHCAAPLVIHVLPVLSAGRILVCHKCLKRSDPPTACPACGSSALESFAIGSQRIEEELKKLFPAARVIRLDADSPTGEETDAPDDSKDLRAFFEKIKAREYDIVIGTERAVKPSSIGTFALTVIVSLNQLLQQPDFRQEERAYGIFKQLAELTERECVIQTSAAGLPLIRDIETRDAESFFKRDIVFRKAYVYPPFAELIKITVTHKLRLMAEKNSLIVKNVLAEEFTKAGIKQEDVFIIGPVPAFIPKEKNEYIYHLVLKIKNRNDAIKDILIQHLPNYAHVDVNPKTIL